MPVDLQKTTDYFKGIQIDLAYIEALGDSNRRKILELMMEEKIKDIFLGTSPKENEVVLGLFSELGQQEQQKIISVVGQIKVDGIEQLLRNLESRKKIEIDDIIERITEDKIVGYEAFDRCGYSGKDITIELPRKGAFKGFNKRYFVSDDVVYYEDYEKEEELREISISDVGVVSLLNAFRSYIKEAYGWQIDPDIDYFEELSKGRYKSRGLDVVKVLTRLGGGKLFGERTGYFIKSIKNDYSHVAFGDSNMFFGRFETGMGMARIFIENNK